jgi:hypothetical protein
VWWFATLIVAWGLQFGIYSDYQDFRAANALWVRESLGIVLPENFSLWWFAIPGALWVLSSLVYRDVLNQLTNARLLFDNLRVERIQMAGSGVLPAGRIFLAKVDVSNCPHNPKRESIVEKANCVATFRNLITDTSVQGRYARWTENPKPRPDETPQWMTPKFRDEMNYRDLAPNRAVNTLDFAVRREGLEFFCAMTAASQGEQYWQVKPLEMGPGNFAVDLVINGAGLSAPARLNVILKNCGTEEFEFFSPADYYLTDAVAYRYAA